MEIRAGLIARLLIILAVLAPSGSAWADDTPRAPPMAGYLHRRWTLQDGAPSMIESLVQSKDGFIWIGAFDGLYRFDGIQFERIPPKHPDARLDERVRDLALAPDGSVIVRYASRPLGRVCGTRVCDLGKVSVPGGNGLGLGFEQNGALWTVLTIPGASLGRYLEGRWTFYGLDQGLPDEQVQSLLVASNGVVWVTTSHTALFRLPGSNHFEATGEYLFRNTALAQDAQGRVWLSDNYTGTRRLPAYDKGEKKPQGAPLGYIPSGRALHRSVVFDSEGTLWGAARGLGVFQIRNPERDAGMDGHSGRVGEEQFQRSDGLTSDFAMSVMSDREGDIWVGTAMGLDMFRRADIAIAPVVTPRASAGYQLFSARDGTVWISDQHAVYQVTPDGSPPHPLPNAFPDPSAICEGPDHSIYISSHDDLRRLTSGREVRLRTPASHVDAMGCVSDQTGSIVFTLGFDGVGRIVGDQLQIGARSAPKGLIAVARAPDGRVIASGLEGDGLFQLKGGVHRRLLAPDLIPIGRIDTIIPVGETLIFGGLNGLGQLKAGQFRWLPSAGRRWLEGLNGLAANGDDLWVYGTSGLSRLRLRDLDAAFSGSEAALPHLFLDTHDGLPGPPSLEARNELAMGGDGRLWIGSVDGVGWLDTRRLAYNSLPPPVLVKSIIADGRSFDATPHLKLPKGGARNLQISFTGLSLRVPERMRFRYRLEGFERDWTDSGDRRQAFYTKLPPGHYRFQVKAANNDGVWNEIGDALEFTIPPAFFQTRPFWALCALAFAGLLWLLYSVRLRQVARRIREGLQERLTERERIARELHDTLLQGFQGLLLRLQAAVLSLPPGYVGRPRLDDALDRAEALLVEGRQRVRDLRMGEMDLDFNAALHRTLSELIPIGTLRSELIEEGLPQELYPIACEELLRVVEEAVTNTLQHARAERLTVTIAWGRRYLSVSVRDDGVGMNADLATRGRENHFGLVGMRERARKLTAELIVSSLPGRGSEISIKVPADIAYAAGPPAPRFPSLIWWKASAA